MWWKKATKEPPDLETRLATVERQVKEVQLEWESAFDKLRSMLARLNKRAERIDASERQEATESAIPTSQRTGTSHALDPMSQRILARRQRLFQQASGNSTEKEKTA